MEKCIKIKRSTRHLSDGRIVEVKPHERCFEVNESQIDFTKSKRISDKFKNPNNNKTTPSDQNTIKNQPIGLEESIRKQAQQKDTEGDQAPNEPLADNNLGSKAPEAAQRPSFDQIDPREASDIEGFTGFKVLPQNHPQYFNIKEDTKLVPIGEIEAIRQRTRGVINANKYMSEANFKNTRDPLHLAKKSGGGYLLLDGNSTYFNAAASGWDTIPATILDKYNEKPLYIPHDGNIKLSKPQPKIPEGENFGEAVYLYKDIKKARGNGSEYETVDLFSEKHLVVGSDEYIQTIRPQLVRGKNKIEDRTKLASVAKKEGYFSVETEDGTFLILDNKKTQLYDKGNEGADQEFITNSRAGKEAGSNGKLENGSRPRFDGKIGYEPHLRRSGGGRRRISLLDDREVDYKESWEVTSELSSKIKEEMPNYTGVQKILEIEDASVYKELLDKGKASTKFGSSVTAFSAQELMDKRLFITEDGQAGLAMTSDGDVQAVFAIKTEGVNGTPAPLLVNAVHEGARSLEGFNTVLPAYYSKFGFKPVARMEFNEEFMPPDWDFETYKKFNDGKPDYVAFVWAGGDRSKVGDKLGTFGEAKRLMGVPKFAKEDYDGWKNAQTEALDLLDERASDCYFVKEYIKKSGTRISGYRVCDTPGSISFESRPEEAFKLRNEVLPFKNFLEGATDPFAVKYGSVTPVNFKSQGSILRKVEDEYNGDINLLKDAIRSTVVVFKGDIQNTLKELKDLEDTTGVKSPFIKVKFQSPDRYGGYVGIISNVRMPSGRLGEVQFNTPDMIFAKEKIVDSKRILGQELFDKMAAKYGLSEGGKGHKFYEQIRTLKADISSGRVPSSEMKKLLRLEKEQEEYYKKYRSSWGL